MSTTSLSLNTYYAEQGTSVTLTAEVTGTTPTGTVTFKRGSTTIGSDIVVAGQASITTTTLPLGSYSLSATYNGDGSNVASTSPAVLMMVAGSPPLSNFVSRQIKDILMHEQSTPSATWVITHNLGSYPLVDAFIMYNGSITKILPAALEYTDMDTVTLTFSTARAGYATVV